MARNVLGNVSSRAARRELERIQQSRGKASPPVVVEESRPGAAALHDCFEWDDAKAAQIQREDTARSIIRTVVVRRTQASADRPVKCQVRMDVEAEDLEEASAPPVKVKFRQTEGNGDPLQEAMAMLAEVEDRFGHLSQLRDVWAALRKVKERQDEMRPNRLRRREPAMA